MHIATRVQVVIKIFLSIYTLPIHMSIYILYVELWVISILDIGHMFPLIVVDINELT